MKDNLEQTKKYSELLEFYGRLLTTSQQQIMSDYYLFDLSLGEISENRKISRSAVLDTITKTAKKLEKFEGKLGLVKHFKEGKEKSRGQVLAALEELEGKIKHGI